MINKRRKGVRTIANKINKKKVIWRRNKKRTHRENCHRENENIKKLCGAQNVQNEQQTKIKSDGKLKWQRTQSNGFVMSMTHWISWMNLVMQTHIANCGVIRKWARHQQCRVSTCADTYIGYFPIVHFDCMLFSWLDGWLTDWLVLVTIVK